jgi:hypothetical protein
MKNDGEWKKKYRRVYKGVKELHRKEEWVDRTAIWKRKKWRKVSEERRNWRRIIPKIPWYQKLVDCNLGSLYEGKNLDKWTTYFTSFPGTPNTSNSNSVCARGKVLFEMDFMFNFLVSYEAHIILVFYFFFTIFLLMVLYDIVFNVTAMIWMWSFWIYSKKIQGP